MKILTYNLNGIRAAIRKGFINWLKTQQADIICLQELKAWENQVNIADLIEMGYQIHWNPAENKGYSGVAIFTRINPNRIASGIGKKIYDQEGRVIFSEFDEFSIVNVYMPSGSSGPERQAFKMRWLREFSKYITDLHKNCNPLIICGDFNICHQSIDIHNPVANKNSPGFTPDERKWMTDLLRFGFIDTFRYFNQKPGNYTWWSLRSKSREKNLGWRIDYILASTSLEGKLKSASILDNAYHSDHCPVVLTLKSG